MYLITHKYHPHLSTCVVPKDLELNSTLIAERTSEMASYRQESRQDEKNKKIGLTDSDN